MAFIMKIFRIFPFLQIFRGIKSIKQNLNISKQTKKEFENFENNKYISITKENLNIFKKAFLKFIWYQSKQNELPLLFLNCKIKKVFENEIDLTKYDPILICVEQNDIDRVKMMINHYRNIGIKKMIFIDNESTDGTFEYLKKQKDVDLYICSTKYTSLNREAWINRIIAHYGFDRWYLCVDSDELFIYENCENKKINKFVEELENNNQRRVMTIMIDMYSKEGIFSKVEQKDIKDTYCYYDYDTYTMTKNTKLNELRGGPRERFFSSNNIEKKFLLTKHPLFKFRKGDIQGSSHFQFPYKDNFNLKIKGAILHYKFLYNDFEKYKKRAEEGNYANGSFEYKAYINKYMNGEMINFYSEHSKKYTTSTEFFKSLKIK